jgi:hypothetical protein
MEKPKSTKALPLSGAAPCEVHILRIRLHELSVLILTKNGGIEHAIDRVRERIDKFANVRRDVVVLLMLDLMHVVPID